MKETFLKIYRGAISRDGSEKLLEWLVESDFFCAPASAKHHLARQGGLAEHSVNVWRRLRDLVASEKSAGNRRFEDVGDETVAICGLLHDLCKVNYYKSDTRNAKDASGQWVKVPFYKVDDRLPYGHGEKSVYIISGFMRLARAEAMAVRWHMGGFDDSVRGGGYSIGAAFLNYPLAVLLHAADLQATYLDEAQT